MSHRTARELHPGSPAGAVFEITAGGSMTILYAAGNGEFTSLLEASDGKLYGTALSATSPSQTVSQIFGLW